MDELGTVPLRALLELSRRGTMAAVADELGYTPGAISQQLAKLESVVGQPLLIKVGRGVRLSDAGRVLALHAEGVLQAQRRALAAARAAQSVAGSITVGVFGSSAVALLAPLVTLLGELHPALSVRSREIPVDAMAQAVRRGEVDVAFAVDYPSAPMPRDPATELVPLVTERFALAVPPLLAEQQAERVGPIHLAQAAQWPWILTPASTPFGRTIRGACRAAGFEPQVVHEVTDTAAAILMASSGLGVTPVTPLMRRLVSVTPTLVDLRDTVERVVVLITPEADGGRPSVAAVVAAAREVTAES